MLTAIPEGPWCKPMGFSGLYGSRKAQIHWRHCASISHLNGAALWSQPGTCAEQLRVHRDMAKSASLELGKNTPWMSSGVWAVGCTALVDEVAPGKTLLLLFLLRGKKAQGSSSRGPFSSQAFSSVFCVPVRNAEMLIGVLPFAHLPLTPPIVLNQIRDGCTVQTFPS